MSRSDPYSFARLWHYYRQCRKGKRNTLNALHFEQDAEAKLLRLSSELQDHSYSPGRSVCFITDGQKPREVFAADFRDRVVHHLLVASQERVFEPRFIHDSYACRVGKGTLAASERLTRLQRKVSANGRRRAWALKLDVADFFASIHKSTLYGILRRAIRDPEVRWLTKVVLYHDPTQDYCFRGRRGRRGGAAGPGTAGYPVPDRKSLFGKGNVHGLPIGNLSSQFWGNVYLDLVDQFVKRRLRCRYYVRYVDDMVLLSERKDELVQWREEIATFLRQRLRLELKAGQRELIPLETGVPYIGWKSWWNRRVPLRCTTGRLRSRIMAFERDELRPAFSGVGYRLELGNQRRRGRGGASGRPGGCGDNERRPSPPREEQFRSTMASYSGHLRHGAAWLEWERIWADYPWLELLFERRGWRLRPRWPSVSMGGPGLRYGSLHRQVTSQGGAQWLVFWPVGRFIEFYGPQRLAVQRLLGLRTASIPRGARALTAGFPMVLAAHFARRALEEGCVVVLVHRDRGREGNEYRPTAVLLPRSDFVSTLTAGRFGPTRNRGTS